MTTVTEIAPDLYRISTYLEPFDLQFNQFVLKDDEPLLFHTGMRAMFPDVIAAVAKVIEPSTLRWIGFSHFEADECGALAQWQQVAPQATAICSVVGKFTSVDDVVALREARALQDGETLQIGRHSLRFLQTPHVPHGWDASMLYEKRSGTLFCSDILAHKGNVPAMAPAAEILERSQSAMRADQASPWAHGYPCSDDTRSTYRRLAELDPQLLAIMHGSAHCGSSRRLLTQYAAALEEFAAPSVPAAGVA